MMPMLAHPSAADEEAFRHSLDRVLLEHLGVSSASATVHRARSEFASSYHAEIVDVMLDDGRRIKLFLKNYGIFRNLKEDMAQRRQREMQVFRELIPDGQLGTPRYYDSVWSEPEGRYWLLLEFVEGTQLRNLGFEHWVGALAWLGRLHTQFHRRRAELERCEWLIRQDEQFFWSTARLAHDVVSRISLELAAQLLAVLGQYEPLVRTMANQPRTLVHGAYRPPNVLMVPGEGERTLRVCPIDWEEASLGSPLYDVAYLCDGFEPPRLDIMWDAYRRQAEGGGVCVPERSELCRVVNCFRVHKLLNLLGKSIHRNYPHAEVAKMIGMADQISRSLQ